MVLTCIIHSVPHLKTTDGAGFVLIVTSEDELQTHEETNDRMSWCRSVKDEWKWGWIRFFYLPLFDLFPQVFELLQIQLSCAVSLRKGQLWKKTPTFFYDFAGNLKENRQSNVPVYFVWIKSFFWDVNSRFFIVVLFMFNSYSMPTVTIF